jgi:hypothetical protein
MDIITLLACLPQPLLVHLFQHIMATWLVQRCYFFLLWMVNLLACFHFTAQLKFLHHLCVPISKQAIHLI